MPRYATTECAIEGCPRRRRGRMWCTTHYQRWRVYGDPNHIEDRNALLFWRNVTRGPDDQCWPWKGTIDRGGYGWFGSRGAHRAAYEKLVGSIPEGLQLDHLCHTRDSSCPGGRSCLHRRCVNPAHLEPVTNRENTLRSSVSVCAVNARKIECPSGHPYDEQNTRWYQGRRYCRGCEKERGRVKRAKKVNAVAS